MTESTLLGYAFEISLPPDVDERMRAWAEGIPEASWDAAGGHVTLAHLTGRQPPQSLLPAVRHAVAGLPAFEVRLSAIQREPYWDKPGLEIVMLAAEREEDVAGVLALRDRLLEALIPEGVTLLEGGSYRPHVTLTIGLPSSDALALEAAAAGLELRFTAGEVVFWSGGERLEGGAYNPKWQVVERFLLP